MGDKSQNQQQQPQSMNNPWGATNPWQCAPMGYYGNQGSSGFGSNMAYPCFPQYFNNPQQQIAFTNANNALMQNGVGNQLSGFIPLKASANNSVTADKSKMNVLPPLPPGPPPPLNGQKFQPPPPPGNSNNNTNNGSYYGQPQNSAYPPITFNMNNKKTGLGFQPMLNNSGAGKKKRRKNKNQMQQMNSMQHMNVQFNNAFQSAGTANTYPPPPLPAELPPPFPPLPPLPSDPPPTTPTGSGNKGMPSTSQLDVEIISGPTITNNRVPMQNQTHYKSPLVPTAGQPKNNWGGLDTSEPWPDSLKAYVNRCYSKCVEDVDKDQVEIILKGKITSAANDGSLWIRNWDLELLPSLYSERKTIEIKKPMFASLPESPKPNPVQRGPPNFLGGKRGRGLSASMGSRLGGFGRAQRQRSRSRSQSPGKGRRRTRSRSRDNSRSPPRRRKDRRSSNESSSSSSENFKPLTVTKRKRGGGGTGGGGAGGGGGRGADNLNKTLPMSKKAKRKMKLDEKAKSHFYSEFGTANREPVNTERLQKRADRFKGTLKTTTSPRGRKRAFSLGVPTANTAAYTIDTISDVDWRNFHIVGTCKDVDKQYLRQTTAPDASTIRPIEVLQKSLVAVQERWKRDSDYFFACDRMKSIRLDLTLQGIRNEFTVKVYETHARIALEKGDHQELNQCLSQLTQLYMEVGGANKLEFTAYGILYYVFTKDTLELTTLLGRLTDAEKSNECVSHALAVRTAWLTSNYHRFFRLYSSAPRMAGYAVELFAERERIAALKVMIKAYRPILPVSYVAKELAFENDAKCLEFLTPFELVFADPQRTKIECKSSAPIIVTK